MASTSGLGHSSVPNGDASTEKGLLSTSAESTNWPQLEREMRTVIIDGVDQVFLNHRSIDRELAALKTDLEIEELRIMDEGGIRIVCKSAKMAEMLLEKRGWSPRTFGGKAKVHRSRRYGRLLAGEPDEDPRLRRPIRPQDQSIIDGKAVFVGNFPDYVTEEELLVSWANEIEGCTIIDSRQGKKVICFAKSPAAAEKIASGQLRYGLRVIRGRIMTPRMKISRCNHCQSLDHESRDCKSDVRCPICAEPHAYQDCPKKEAPVEQRLCAICNQPGHGAAYLGCEIAKQRERQVRQANGTAPQQPPRFIPAPIPSINPWTSVQTPIEPLVERLVPVLVPLITKALDSAIREMVYAAMGLHAQASAKVMIDASTTVNDEQSEASPAQDNSNMETDPPDQQAAPKATSAKRPTNSDKVYEELRKKFMAALQKSDESGRRILDYMTRQEYDKLVKLDAKRKPPGFVERDQNIITVCGIELIDNK